MKGLNQGKKVHRGAGFIQMNDDWITFYKQNIS